MQNKDKPVRFGVLAAEIVRTLQARHSSKAAGRSITLKVIPINSFQESAVNPPRHNDSLRDALSKTMKVRKIGSAR